jgi:signal transduction histidine kinase
MANMTKLLNKPLRAFTIYALVILLASVPAYFFVVDYIWLGELDEHNQLIKNRIERHFSKQQVSDEQLQFTLDQWSIIEPGTSVTPVAQEAVIPDFYYEVTKTNEFAEKFEMDRFRGFCSYIQINGKPYRLNIETNIEEADETILAIAIITTLFFILLVLGFIYLNKSIAKKAWQPFYETLRKLADFDLSRDRKLHFDATDIEEFQTLNETLTKLIDRNVDVFAQQKAFIENASHELQTPIAVLKSKLDMLIQHADMAPDQLQIINALHLPMARISRINKNLLLLAKIENNQFLDAETVDLSETVTQSIEFLEDYSNEKQMQFVQKVDGQCMIHCNRLMCETLINNLLSNAIRHGLASSVIQVNLTQTSLSISNVGASKLDTQQIYQRFSASSTSSASSGLGLAIVKEICARYKWTIHYDFIENNHVFSVSF